MVVDGSRGRGRPKKNWTDTVKEDSKAWKMTCVDPMDRVLWTKNLKKKIIKKKKIIINFFTILPCNPLEGEKDTLNE
jgi:hypothetical protein